MKILHTSDWHLGKKLEGAKRIDEQKKFIDTLQNIVETHQPQLILIAGDIFDSPLPSSEAHKLFFDSLQKISDPQKRAVVIIPGNHDSPQRLGIGRDILSDMGVIIYEDPFEIKEIGSYGGIKIIKSNEGGAILDILGEKIFLYSLPYMSDILLENKFYEIFGEDENLNFSQKVGKILSSKIDELKDSNIPTVIMSHLFVTPTKNSQDDMSLGGSKKIDIEDFPEVDYIALGHIHKPLVFSSKRAVYCGSPIEYRITENRYQKKVFLVDIRGNLDTQIEEITLENYKPIKRYEVSCVEEATEFSLNMQDAQEWIYLKINTSRYLSSGEIREIYKNKNIVEIDINFKGNDIQDEIILENKELNIEESFKEFYKSFDGIEASQEITDLFMSLVKEER